MVGIKLEWGGVLKNVKEIMTWSKYLIILKNIIT